MTDPFEGWTMAEVGCHWSRELPGGKTAYLSTYHCGDESGYTITVDYKPVKFPDLASALIGYDQLATYYKHLFTGDDALLGPRNDPPDLHESVSYR
jgi:hypothetical protein